MTTNPYPTEQPSAASPALLWSEGAHLQPPSVSNVANLMIDAAGFIITFGFASPPLQTGNAEIDANQATPNSLSATVVSRVILTPQTVASLISVLAHALNNQIPMQNSFEVSQTETASKSSEEQGTEG